MNKYYTLLGVGLLSAATLISCQEEVLLNAEVSLPEEDHTFKAMASIESFRTDAREASSRANVEDDGKSFLWNTRDRITLWDGTAGHAFTISEHYDDTKFPSARVPFYTQEELAWTDGMKVWGIYPEKPQVTVENVFAFDLAEEQTVVFDSHPHLQSTMYMVAEGTVQGAEVGNLAFRHLTGLFQFNLTNLRDNYNQVSVTSVTVEASAPVFSKRLVLNSDGQPEAYAPENLVQKLTWKPQAECALGVNQSISIYQNFFPTTALTSDAVITFTVNYTENGEAHTAVKTGTVGELYAGQPLMTQDGGQYVAGKRYVVNMDVALQEDERGYTNEGEGHYTVHTGKGLLNLVKYEAEGIAAENVVITLDGDAYDLDGSEWTPIPVFSGTFDGNGKTVTNFTIVPEANGGFILLNQGTVKNLRLDRVTLTTRPVEAGDAEANSNAILVAQNQGLITECEVCSSTLNSTITVSGNAGMVAGYNMAEGRILNTRVAGASQINVTGVGPRTGGLVGHNVGSITLSSVEQGMEINMKKGTSGVPNVGGLVGWNQNGPVVGCAASARIYSDEVPMKVGGLLGVCNGNMQGKAVEITASYSAGEFQVIGTNHSTIGGLIGSGGDTWAKSPLKITGCYTVTSLQGAPAPQNGGGFIGSHDLSQVGLELNACVFSNEKTNMMQNTPTYEGVMYEAERDGVSKHAEEMNASIVDTELEYVQGGAVPLILQPVSPGWGGPDFGDGDEI